MDKTKERNSHGAESQGGYRRRTLALEATGIIYFYDKVAKRYGRLTYRYVYLRLWLGEELGIGSVGQARVKSRNVINISPP